MRVVAGQTIGLFERLVIVRLFEVGTRRIMAVETKSRSGLREVVVEFAFTYFASLVRNVASAATHIERCMPTTALRDVDANLVAGEAEIFILVFAFGGLQ
jgi:hypothetical protein